MSDEKGYIKLYRGITENFLWQAKATKLQAWLDLLMMVNYQDKKTLFNERVVTVRRGEIITSEVKLAARWGWNKRTVTNFLEVLESEEMVKVKKSHICTTIYVVNYCKYQGFSENSTQPNAQQTTQPSTQLTAQLNAHNIKKEEEREESKEGKRNNNNPPLSPLGDSTEEKPKKKSPSREDIQKEINAVIDESELSQEVKDKLKEFVEYRRKLKCKFFTGTKYFKSDTLKDAIKCEKEHGSYATIKCIENTFAQGYQGVFFNKAYQYAKDQPKQQIFNMDDFMKRFSDGN